MTDLLLFKPVTVPVMPIFSRNFKALLNHPFQSILYFLETGATVHNFDLSAPLLRALHLISRVELSEISTVGMKRGFSWPTRHSHATQKLTVEIFCAPNQRNHKLKGGAQDSSSLGQVEIRVFKLLNLESLLLILDV